MIKPYNKPNKPNKPNRPNKPKSKKKNKLSFLKPKKEIDKIKGKKKPKTAKDIAMNLFKKKFTRKSKSNKNNSMWGFSLL